MHLAHIPDEYMYTNAFQVLLDIFLFPKAYPPIYELLTIYELHLQSRKKRERIQHISYRKFFVKVAKSSSTGN